MIKLTTGDIKGQCTVQLPAIDIYFSYNTPIEFRYKGELVIRVNDWSAMTSRHLNQIDGGSKEAKANRIPGKEFESMLEAIMRGGGNE